MHNGVKSRIEFQRDLFTDISKVNGNDILLYLQWEVSKDDPNYSGITSCLYWLLGSDILDINNQPVHDKNIMYWILKTFFRDLFERINSIECRKFKKIFYELILEKFYNYSDLDLYDIISIFSFGYCKPFYNRAALLLTTEFLVKDFRLEHIEVMLKSNNNMVVEMAKEISVQGNNSSYRYSFSECCKRGYFHCSSFF